MKEKSLQDLCRLDLPCHFIMQDNPTFAPMDGDAIACLWVLLRSSSAKNIKIGLSAIMALLQLQLLLLSPKVSDQLMVVG
jgi:hypothetical protein